MRICVFGLWRLGTVTAGCVAAARQNAASRDFDATASKTIAYLDTSKVGSMSWEGSIGDGGLDA
jgi:hypothetical protein